MVWVHTMDCRKGGDTGEQKESAGWVQSLVHHTCDLLLRVQTRLKQKISYATSCKLGLRMLEQGCDSLLIRFRSTCVSNLE